MLLVLLLVKHGEKVLPAAARCCDHSAASNSVPVHHEYEDINHSIKCKAPGALPY